MSVERVRGQERPPPPDDGSRGRAQAPGLPALDGESRQWLQRLNGNGAVREQAIEDLHALMLKAARFALARPRALFVPLRREPLDELAFEAADDAVIAVLAHLDSYRGESRFTTWAWKFAFLQTLIALKRRRWMEREIPVERDGWQALSREVSPQRRAEERELLSALRRAVEEELTAHQRTVFVALALNHVPIDVLAEQMETTRGALYKTLHDARSKLRAQLAADGQGPEEWRTASRRPPVDDRPAARRRLRLGRHSI